MWGRVLLWNQRDKVQQSPGGKERWGSGIALMWVLSLVAPYCRGIGQREKSGADSLCLR